MNSPKKSKLGGEFDLAKVVKNYTRNWKWFVITTVFALISAFLFIRYSTPKYASFAKIQLLEEKTANPELGLFQDLNFLTPSSNRIDDEIEILNSRSNFVYAVKKLNLNVKFFVKGKIKDTELYSKLPLNFSFIAPDSLIHKAKTDFKIRPLSKNEFEFSQKKEKISGRYNYGSVIETSIGQLIITPNVIKPQALVGNDYKVEIVPLEKIVDYYKKKTIIVKLAELSGVLNLIIQDPIPQRGRDILDALIKNYNESAIADKKAIADKTSEFIDNRITEIYSNLSEVEDTAENFKADRGLTDIQSQANLNLSVSAENQRQIQSLSTQLNLANSMKDYVETQQGFDVLPANIGLQDNAVAGTTEKYNRLALERKRLLESSNEMNPTIINLDQQLSGLKESLQSSLSGITTSLDMQLESLQKQTSRINAKIYSAPKNERALRDITRQQQTKESLYLYLLQKREESQITFASAKPKSKIIDSAYSLTEKPVSPKTPVILIGAIMLGILLPFVTIYIGDLLDNKIHSKVDLENYISGVPVLSEIPKLNKKDNKLIVEIDRTVLAESFRILRTNLDYTLRKASKSNKKKQNIIFITSSVPSDGKTLVSTNLSMVMSMSKKKVLLIGADIRNPKILSFFESGNADSEDVLETEVGLSNFLSDDELTIDDIVQSKTYQGFSIDVILSGDIPPNPTELFMSERVEELLNQASKSYDYVIVDTAPVIPVTDTVLISEYAHMVLYVINAGVTEKKVLDFPIKLKEEGNFSNLAFVVNRVRSANLGYGGKYTYGYGTSKSKFKQFFSTS